MARDRGVAVVVAAGNNSRDFYFEGQVPPANNPVGRVSWLGRLKELDVITVGAVDVNGARLNRPAEEFVSGAGPALDVVAPGVLILSTFPTSAVYNPSIPCQTASPAQVGSQYGWCSGTSMAAPHVSAAVALAMSANPMVGGSAVRRMVIESGDRATRTDELGNGVPNVLTLVNKALGGPGVTNRRTPLFGFYSSTMQDHFYTVFPQMGASALNGTLPPVIKDTQPEIFHSLYFNRVYQSEGVLLLDYAFFPGTCADPTRLCNTDASRRPKAVAEVLTLPQPYNDAGTTPSHGTTPLYRFSYQFVNQIDPFTKNDVLRHSYVREDERDAYLSWGWKLDGIEGYIHPVGLAPPNSRALCRGYNGTLNDRALYLASGTTCPSTFMAGTNSYNHELHLGFAYSVTDPATDSDGDGRPDVVEFTDGTNPVVKDNNVLGDGYLFARQQYRDILMREAPYSEYWLWGYNLSLPSPQGSRQAMIEAFLRAPEYVEYAGPATRLYKAYFLRVPDVGGLRFWTTQYKTGSWTFIGISDFFAISPEFKQRYGALNNGQFVDLIYQNVLGRASDATGRQYWVSELDSGRRTRGSVMAAISESPENKGLQKGLVEVVGIYATMLGQEVDQAKLNQWGPVVTSGGSS